MDWQAFVDNILSPPILFFVLGVIACLAKSDLDIPAPVPKLLSIYLLISIGFKGGLELNDSPFSGEIVGMLGAAVFMASVVPVIAFMVLRRMLNRYDAAAIAATYGSISAVTFMAATAFLDRGGEVYGGHMVAAMALMESPAIVVALLLLRLSADKPETPAAPEPHATQPQGETDLAPKGGIGSILHEAFLNGPIFCLLGGLVIGMLVGDHRAESVKPLTHDLFKGVLCLFLLDMGLVAAKELRAILDAGVGLIGFAIVVPVLSAIAGIGLAWLLSAATGDALLLAILCGSASYIAVPAAMRVAVPQANPSLYVPMALAITFPLNIVFGIPAYWAMIDVIWR